MTGILIPDNTFPSFRNLRKLIYMSSGADFAGEIFFTECSAVLIRRRNFPCRLFGKQQYIAVIRYKRYILAFSDFAIYIVFKLFAPSVRSFPKMT